MLVSAYPAFNNGQSRVREKGVKMYSPDNLDLSILAELTNNARLAVSELARRLDAPTSTIRDRMRKLEEEGVIQRYTVSIDYTKLGFFMKAVIKAKRDQSVSLEEILSEPAGLPEIVRLQILTGETDELITVFARDTDHLKNIIFNKFAEFTGINQMSTAIVMDERDFPLIHRLTTSLSTE
jgi:Lrp/AsnC family transcriptional regulator for asnA, asnC and gidA